MNAAHISFGLGEHEDAARALLRSEWSLADLPSDINEPRLWTMTSSDVDGLAGLTVVTNGFKGAQAADELRPYKPVLEYLVIDRRARGRGLGRQLARHVLDEAGQGTDRVTV
ncbi:GNAT family N-acetyltransferase [Streptomyces sp. NPDC102270]|uniref:GNAT family N-acetyltransferase n=1 Tax=Streptomyces sp. NPDC102270 TaxID=3366150 RepID=UPI00380BEFDF